LILIDHPRAFAKEEGRHADLAADHFSRGRQVSGTATLSSVEESTGVHLEFPGRSFLGIDAIRDSANDRNSAKTPLDAEDEHTNRGARCNSVAMPRFASA
jgi:hypothetical protein